MQFTEHFGLSQWERSDRIQMDDFNADNAKIDAALAAASSGWLGRSEIITILKSSSSLTSSWGASNLIQDWNEWEYVAALVSYQEEDNLNTPLRLWITHKEPSNPGLIINSLTLPGYLLVFLPWHDGSMNMRGFVISDRLIPLPSNFPFSKIASIQFETADQTKLHAPTVTFFGAK